MHSGMHLCGSHLCVVHTATMFTLTWWCGYEFSLCSPAIKANTRKNYNVYKYKTYKIHHHNYCTRRVVKRRDASHGPVVKSGSPPSWPPPLACRCIVCKTFLKSRPSEHQTSNLNQAYVQLYGVSKRIWRENSSSTILPLFSNSEGCCDLKDHAEGAVSTVKKWGQV